MTSWLPRSPQETYEQLHTLLTQEGLFTAPHRMLQRAAQLFPQRTALISGNTSATYQELSSRAGALSSYLTTRAIGHGSKVIIYAENSIFFFTAYYGIWQTGATPIPLNIFLHTHEIERILADAQPNCMVVGTSLDEHVQQLTFAGPIIRESEIAQLPAVAHYPIQQDSQPDPALILYTSGTTGTPKGVVLSASAIMHNVIQGISAFQFSGTERILCPLPLFHIFPQNCCVWAAVFMGATIILLPKISRSALIAAVHYQPTIVMGVPAFYGLLCKFPDLTFPATRIFVTGGDALPANIRLFFALRYGRKLCNGYGLTETAPIIAVDLDDTIGSTHRIGKPLPAIRAELRNCTDGIGTLWVTGPNLMTEYFHALDATRAILQDGWLNTGDLARYDSEGNLVICGREKDLIVSKGIKIYPQEVETVLTSHFQVLMAAVIARGTPGDEVPVAHVQLRDGETCTPDILRTWCLQNLAPYKIPREVIIHHHLPVTATGKIDKKALKSAS